ncbi:energy transducer TonB [Sphingomonas sp.]|uniref:energy transducer TonB n=1 Tax=Sphingomonas sp. TaxID=28214 RepID=UPI003B000E08
MPLLPLLLAAAAPPPVLTSVGPWVVNVSENMCLLQRSFPVGEKKVMLVFQPLLDLDSMELYVITDDTSQRQYQGNYTARIGREGQEITGRYYSVWAAASRSRITRLTTDRTVLEHLQDGDTLAIEARPVNLSFRIVRPANARTALQSCIVDLKRSWGIDPDVASRTATQLEGNPAQYFGPDSYPREALRQGIYGRVIALLNTTPAGTVERCHIVSSAGPALNDGTCKAAMRIRFRPARDADGKPLPSTYLLPVRWILP